MIGLGDHGRVKPTIPSGNRLRLLLPDDHLPPPKIILADGTMVDDTGEVMSDCEDSGHEKEAGNDVEASDDSEDENQAPDYKIQKPDASLLPRAVTKVKCL